MLNNRALKVRSWLEGETIQEDAQCAMEEVTAV
jgi:hypothetical protein